MESLWMAQSTQLSEAFSSMIELKEICVTKPTSDMTINPVILPGQITVLLERYKDAILKYIDLVSGIDFEILMDLCSESEHICDETIYGKSQLLFGHMIHVLQDRVLFTQIMKIPEYEELYTAMVKRIKYSENEVTLEQMRLGEIESIKSERQPVPIDTTSLPVGIDRGHRMDRYILERKIRKKLHNSFKQKIIKVNKSLDKTDDYKNLRFALTKSLTYISNKSDIDRIISISEKVVFLRILDNKCKSRPVEGRTDEQISKALEATQDHNIFINLLNDFIRESRIRSQNHI